jgi:spore coat protein SA
VQEYLIQPWDNEEPNLGINLDMWVPPEIDELALEVMSNYDMVVHEKIFITSKPDKGGVIWKIETNKGPRSIKVLHRKPIRSLFSVGAQDYLVGQGGRVPELKKTRNGASYIEKGGKLWIVTDWIENLAPATKDLKGAQALCYGLGEFHRHSRGYIPPKGSQKASRLYRWPAYYRKIIRKIDWFRNVARSYGDLPGSQALLSVIGMFEQQAKDALSFLEKSAYAQMVSKGEEYWGLVHQDYGWSNGQLGPGGLWVIDLDGVAYDLPIRDLRKLISGKMDDMGQWDVAWIRGMIDAYHQANPLDQQTYEILLNDLAFPNEFYKNITEMLFDPLNFITNNVETIIRHLILLEETKGLAIAELKEDKQKLEKGNYGSRTDLEPEALEMIQRKVDVENTTLRNLLSKKQLKADPLAPDDADAEKSLQNKSPKLKVLMICTEKLPVPPVRGGAIQTYIQGISGILSKQHDLTILGTTDSSLPLEERRNDIRYVRIDGGKVFEIYAEKVVSYLAKNSFDLIHVFNRPRLIPLIRRVAPHSRLILSMHNDMFYQQKILPADAQTAIKEVERIITVSDYVGKEICRLYPQAASKVQTIYSGVNLNTFVPWRKSDTGAQIRRKIRQEYNLESKTVILFVGRLTPKKGPDLLIQALNELYPSNSNIALVIVGGTWYSVDTITDYVAYVRTLAERAPFPVITTGYVDSELIHQWFGASDIFVCSSTWQEPLARVHYEAMAAGLPFLTTARGGNPEIVLGQNGLIVERPEDPKEFAQKLKILLADPKLCQAMGENGRRLAEKHFSWERVAEEVLEAWKPKPKKIDVSAENDTEEENNLFLNETDLTEELITKTKIKDKKSGGKKAKKKEIDAGKKTKEKEIDAGKKTKEKEIDAGKKTKEKEIDAGKKTKEKEIDAGKKTKEKEIEPIAGSSTVRITSDMFVPRKPNNVFTNIIGSSVVRVTQDMMSR